MNHYMDDSLLSPRPTEVWESCALEYRASGTSMLATGNGPVLAIAYRCASNQLVFAVEPDWRTLVKTDDVEEVKQLLQDIYDRSASEPVELWSQLIGLNWGLIVAGRIMKSTSETHASAEATGAESSSEVIPLLRNLLK